MKQTPSSFAWSLAGAAALLWMANSSLSAAVPEVVEPFDYDIGILGDAHVTGTGLEGAWFGTPQRPHGASLKIAAIDWLAPDGYGHPIVPKGLGGEVKGEAAVLLQQPVDFDTDGEVWFSFFFRRPDNVAGSVGLFSLSNGQQDIARLWQTVGGGGVRAGLALDEDAKSSGDLLPKRNQDVFVVGRLQTAFAEADSLALQITSTSDLLPLSFSEEAYVEAPVHGVANWLRFWNFLSEPATEAYFGNLIFGKSYEDVTGLSSGEN